VVAAIAIFDEWSYYSVVFLSFPLKTSIFIYLMPKMISVAQAIEKISYTTEKLDVVEASLLESMSCCLAADIYSPIDMPPFDQSAMDGYAICGGSDEYLLKNEIKAGDMAENVILSEGEAVRIFTGSIVPAGATAVVPQEIVEADEKMIRISQSVQDAANIRKRGEEIAESELVLSKGSVLNVAAIGFLSGLGISHVQIYRKPRIALAVTGNELIQPGQKLSPGKIYESNAATIRTVLRCMGLESTVSFVRDDYMATKDCISDAISNNDLIIATGGISVGDYDFVGKALSELGVQEVFYKVNQKPGKPLYFGLKENKPIFALPGNPAAALTCFYMYVLPTIRQMMGYDISFPLKQKAILKHNYFKKGTRAQFSKANLEQGKVTITTKQSSSMLSSFIDANCLAFIPENVNEVPAGDEIEVYLIPTSL
jgi:molybdopterin molybdotransferase